MSESHKNPNDDQGNVPDPQVKASGYSKSKSPVISGDGAVMSPLATILPDWDLLPEQQQIIRRSGSGL